MFTKTSISRKSIQSILASLVLGVVASPFASAATITIQAEGYTYASGVSVTGTGDIGGGSQVGNIDKGDWMSYPAVTLPCTGYYTVGYRVATPNTGTSMKLEKAGGSATYNTVTIPSTGSWGTWKTVTQTVYLTKGTINFGISIPTLGGFNFNYITLTDSCSSTTTSSSSSSVSSSSSSSSSTTTTTTTGPTLTDNMTNGYSSVWYKADWQNGAPFGCKFNTGAGYIYPSTSGTSVVLKTDADACAELFTSENYTYGTLEFSMGVTNTPGSVGSAFLISGGSGSTSAWQEIDVEILPSASFAGKVHFAVIYQPYNNGNWGLDFGEKIYDTYAVNPIPIGTAGVYKVEWSSSTIKFYAAGKLLWTVIKGYGSPMCDTTVDSNVASPTCYIPTAEWPSAKKSIRLNEWSGNGADWPGVFSSTATGYAWYDWVTFK